VKVTAAGFGDPILDAYYDQGLVFDLSDRLRPGSVRDQIVRGVMLVERAIEHRLISPERPLLVIGGGAAGMAAAITAVRLGCACVVLERIDASRPHEAVSALFGRMANCQTRWVQPTLYEYPAHAWDEHRFPFAGRMDLPLSYEVGRAVEIVAGWQLEVAQVASTGDLHMIPGVLLTKDDWHDDGVDFVITNKALLNPLAVLPLVPNTFGMAIRAIGAGPEATSVDESTYVSYRFWENDTLDHADFGLPAGSANRFLLSGSGDGTLQDALRLYFRPDVPLHELMKQLLLPKGVQARLDRIEASAGRQWLWNDVTSDCRMWRQLDEEHVALATELVHRRSIRRTIRSQLRSRLPSVDIVLGCYHFANVYSLNRFAFWLLHELLAHQNLPVPTLQFGCQTARIDSTATGESAADFYKSPATVHVREGCQCGHGKTGAITLAGEYDAVLLRHGPRGMTTGRKRAERRHLLPAILF
jgi:hypothetical protein